MSYFSSSQEMDFNKMSVVGLLPSLKMRLISLLVDSFLSLDVKRDLGPFNSIRI